jgi:hypothetical protein
MANNPFGSDKGIAGHKTFPHPVSAWWIPILLGIGWLPFFVANAVARLWPVLDNHEKVTAFMTAWGWDIGLPSLGLSAISIIIQIFRLAQWEMHRSEPKN